MRFFVGLVMINRRQRKSFAMFVGKAKHTCTVTKTIKFCGQRLISLSHVRVLVSGLKLVRHRPDREATPASSCKPTASMTGQQQPLVNRLAHHRFMASPENQEAETVQRPTARNYVTDLYDRPFYPSMGATVGTCCPSLYPA